MAPLILLVRVLGWTAFALAAAGTGYALLAARQVDRFAAAAARARTRAGRPPDGVAILKPLHGAEPGLRQNLDSFFSEAARARAAIVLGLKDEADPALKVAQDLMAQRPEVAARLVVRDRVLGANGKISNLANLSEGLQSPILVLSDSDIAAPEAYLAVVVEALKAPGVGIVTCPYVGRAEGGLAARLAAMGVSYQFLPNVLCGVALGLARPCMGSTIALRAETLKAVGGFEAFRDVLADDYALGAAVRTLGQASALAPVLVSHTCAEADLGALLAHEGRWALTVRGVDPLGHAGSLLTHPLPLALLSFCLLGPAPPALLLLLLALLARALVKRAVDRAAGAPSGAFWLLPLRDIVSLLVFVRSFFARSVEWRGERFHVTQSGGLRPF